MKKTVKILLCAALAAAFALVPLRFARAEGSTVTGTLEGTSVTVTLNMADYGPEELFAQVAVTLDNTAGAADVAVDPGKLLLPVPDYMLQQVKEKLPAVVPAGKVDTVEFSARVTFAEFKNANNHKGEKLKLGIQVLYDVLPDVGSISVEMWPREDYIEFTVFDTDGNRIIDLGEGPERYALLYVEIPSGMTAQQVQAKVGKPIKSAQQEVQTVAIDGIPYAKIKVVSFAGGFDDLKDMAKADIAAYKNPADYRAAQQAELQAAIAAANSAIDAAEVLEQVEDAMEAAREALDKIKTDAQLKEEELPLLLLAKKAAAKEEIAAYKNPADYHAAQQAELQAAIAAANGAIDAAEDLQALEDAVAAAKEALDKIKTKAEGPLGDVPKTADAAHLGLYLALMLVSAAAACAALRGKRTN